ncbi:MAG: hypothetical protein HRU69_12755 [Flammeovirgaceae bacterium]|nr:MAG: hypothetical protein HRU69_12755 [Flammeovirgaceae bacterium]
MKISKQFLREALAIIFNDQLFTFSPSDDFHHADPYLFEQSLKKLAALINNNPHSLYYFRAGLAFLYNNPKLVHPGLLSLHAIPFTTQEIKPILAKAFNHFWPDEDIASYNIDHLLPVEIVEMSEDEWRVRTTPDSSEGGLFKS